MWKYLENAQPPESKRKQTDTERKDKQRDYEKKKRSRGYVEEWKSQFPWLVTDTKSDGTVRMFCEFCKVYEKFGTFVTGGTNYKKESLISHNISKSHILNSDRYMAQQMKTSKPGTSVAEKTLQVLNQTTVNRLKLLFRNAHAIAKKGRPYTDFVWLTDLDESKDIDVGSTYRNDKRATEFVGAIASCHNNKIVQRFKEAKFFSLISDGATDSSRQEAEILYIKVCIDGVDYTNFIAIRNVAKADAENISGMITKLLDDKFGDEWLKKLVGTATDGASVMIGERNGVTARLKRHIGRESMYVMHCSAHRLELCYKDSCNKISLYKKQETLLLNLYLFYRNSPLNRANLKAAFNVFKRKMVVPVRAGGTRWLPHLGRALRNIVVGFGPIMTHLTQMQNPSDRASKGESAAKARNFIKLLKSRDMVYFIHFVWDIVDCLQKVSLAFQSTTATVADVYEEIEAAKAILKSYENSDGPKLSSVKGKDTFDSVELSGNDKIFEASKKTLLQNILVNLDKRFDMNNVLLRATSIARLSTYPSDITDDPAFGDKDIKLIAEHFSEVLRAAEVDIDQIVPEWIRFKTLLYSCFNNVQTCKWRDIHSRLKSKCPVVLNVLDLLMSLPASSAEAERGFSKMKMVKSDWRSCLQDKHLSDILTVIMETPDIKEFDPEDSVQYWISSAKRPRRPDYMEENKLPAATGQEITKLGTQQEVATTSVQTVTEETHDTEPVDPTLINAGIERVNEVGLAAKDLDNMSDYFSESDLDEPINEEEAYKELKQFI